MQAITDTSPVAASGGQEGSSRKRNLSIWLRAALGLITFGALFFLLEPSEVIRHLASLNWGYVLGGFGLCMVVLAARAYKWMLIMRQVGLSVSFWRVTEIYTISYWFNMFLPGSMGSDIYRVVDVARASDKVVRPAVTVMLDRITGVLALVALPATVLLMFQRDLPVHGWLVWTSLALSTGAVAALIGTLFYFDKIWAVAIKIAPFLGRLLKPAKVAILADLSAELRTQPQILGIAFVWGIVVQVLVLSAYYVLARAVAAEVSELYFFTFFPLIEIASMAPISINGIGIREGLMVYSLQEFAITPATAMSMGVLYRLNTIAHGLLGGALLIFRRSDVWRIQPT